MSRSEQLTFDRGPAAARRPALAPRPAAPATDRLKAAEPRRERERAAKRSLRAQIARLERELSELIAAGFPHLTPAPMVSGGGAGAPRLLSLAELERERDALVRGLRETQLTAAARAAREAQARELLAAMTLEPARHKFMRLRVADLGDGGCGVWEVRPRLGLIGMLAGWWQLKLSSGCPLATGPRRVRGPELRSRRCAARSSRCAPASP